jgi:hypothetical protein
MGSPYNPLAQKALRGAFCRFANHTAFWPTGMSVCRRKKTGPAKNCPQRPVIHDEVTRSTLAGASDAVTWHLQSSGRNHMNVKIGASALALLALLSAGAATAQAQASGQVQVIRSSINPAAPRVGEYYTLSVTVQNNTGGAVVATVSLHDWPNGDIPQSSQSVAYRLTPGSSATYQFTFYCGVEGGVVRYNLSAYRAN